MPNKDGHEALKGIKSDPKFSSIPVIIMATSNNRDEITRCYDMGASSLICKPSSYDELQRIADAFCHYWMRVATLPQQEQQRGTP
jgi:CheY-like chemotaxis protein